MKSEAATPTKSTPAALGNTPWRLSPALRKTMLVLHSIIAISWMGVDIALLVLLMIARTSSDPALVFSGFNAIRMIVPVTTPVLSVGILATGVILGLGTRWGLLRYWWVLIKLLLSVVMAVLVFTSLIPGVDDIAVSMANGASADAIRAGLGRLPTMLLFPPLVSFLMLGVATILSVFKPWRLTPWSRANSAQTEIER